MNATGAEGADSDPPTTATPILINFANLRNAGNGAPQGIWSNGTTMWVTDLIDDKFYAYNLTSKAREPGNDFNTATGHDNPSFI